MALRCIICDKHVQALRGLCTDCLSERKKFVEVPGFSELTVCAHCGSVLLKKRWEDAPDLNPFIIIAAKSALKLNEEEGVTVEPGITLTRVDDYNVDAAVDAVVKIGDKSFVQSGKMRVRVRRGSCERCSKMHGKYFESTLQVRADGRALSDGEMKLVHKVVSAATTGATDRETYIEQELERDGGVDFRMGKISVAKSISRFLADAMGGKIIETTTLAGRKEGKELFRVTFLVRAPPFQKGDFIKFRGRVMLVTHVSTNGTSATELRTGNSEVVGKDDLGNARKIGGSELIEDAVVVHHRKPELEIMDPSSYRSVNIVAPGWFWENVAPESVRILKDGDDLYLVPGNQ